MDARYEPVRLTVEEFEDNGDSFQQQIDQHIQDLNQPLPHETHPQYDINILEAGRHEPPQQKHEQLNQENHSDQHAQQNQQIERRQQESRGQAIEGQGFQLRRQPILQVAVQGNAKRSIITINGIVPNSNRFYLDEQRTRIISQNVTPPKPLSVGMVINNNPAPHPVPQMAPNVRVENDHQTLIRSRVISEVQKPPLFYVPPTVKPQSTTVIRSQERIRQIPVQQAAQFNRSLQVNMAPPVQRVNLPPTGSRLQERPIQFVTQSRSQSPTHPPAPTPIHNPLRQNQPPATTIQHRPQPQPLQPPHQPQPQPHQIPVPMPQSQQQSQPQPQSQLIKFERIRVQIRQFNTQMRRVSDLIRIMLNGEEDRHKLEFINGLMRDHVGLEEKLLALTRDLDQVNLDSYRNAAIRNASNTKQVIYSNNPQPQVTAPPRAQLQPQLQSLNQKIHALQSQNETLIKKYLILQQQMQSPEQHLSYDELLQTIESQKVIIKRLQQQLISTNNQPISQQTRDNNDDGNLTGVQSKFMAIIDSKQAYINQLEAEIIRHKTQIKSLKQQVIKERNQRSLAEQVSEELESQSHKDTTKSNTQYPIINNNTKEIEKLQKIIKQKDDQLDHIKQKIFQIQDEFDQTLDQRNSKIKQLHEQIMTISENAVLQKKQQTEQISLQLQTTRNELTSKSEQLKKSKEKITQLESSVKQLQNQKQKLAQSLKQMEMEEQRLRASLDSLQHELKNGTGQAPLQALIQTLKKKQNELARQKQVQEMHLHAIDQLQKQVGFLRDGYKNIEVSMVEERRLSTQKYTEYENMIKLISSRGEPNPKSEQPQVQKMQHMIVQLKGKIKTMQQQHQLQQSTITNHPEHRDFRLQYSTSQVKIFQLQNTLKQRENRIKQLQSNIETMRLKINHNALTQQDIMMNQEIQMLRKKVQELETHGKTGQTAAYKVRDYQSNSLFQQRIIYELKAENQRLKSMLSKQDWKDAHSYTSSPRRTNRSPKKLDKYQQSCIITIQSRLSQFNKKLTELINNNRQLPSNQSPSHQSHQPHMMSSRQQPNNQLIQLLQKQKNNLLRTHHREIEALQARIVDLQRYCSSLEFRDGIATYQYNYTATQLGEGDTKNMYAEQIQYYKGKNKELENRIDALLQLNKQLKDKLAIYMKPQGDHNLQFYKTQSQKLQSRLADLQSTIKSLKQQKTGLLLTIQKLQSDKSSQNMIQSLQHSLQEQNTKLQKLQYQNGMLEEELKKYTQQVIDFSSEKLLYKTKVNQLENKISLLQQSLKKSNNQIQEDQRNITKLGNQVAICKEEIDRLKEELGRSKSEYDRESSGLKAKISDLQQQIRHLQNGVQTSEHASFVKEQSIATLNTKLSTVERNLTNEISKNTSLNQKLTAIQAELTRVTTEKNQLSQLIEKLTTQISNLTLRLKQTKQEFARATTQTHQNHQKISQLQDLLRRVREQLQLYKVSKSKQIEQKHQIEQELSTKISQLYNLKLYLSNIKYQVEFVRSVFIEIQVLVGEIGVGQKEGDKEKEKEREREKGVLGKVKEEVGRGLGCCQEIGINF